jgi:hypothetical protein
MRAGFVFTVSLCAMFVTAWPMAYPTDLAFDTRDEAVCIAAPFSRGTRRSGSH